MAVALRCAGQSAFRVLRACCSVTGRNFILPSHKQDKEKAAPVTEVSFQKLGFEVYVTRVPRALEFLQETSLSRPPWPDLSVIDPVEGEKQQLAVISKVNNILATEKYGRLFAVVHFASRQWKVTNEDLILIENHIDAECGERIRLEKVLLVGSADFTLIGRPLLGRNLVSVEATVIEKTKSWPMVHMRFWKRHRYQRKRIIVQPQTVLRINAIRVAPDLA